MQIVRTIIVLAALALPAPLAAQDDAQARLWDASIAGDTAGIRAAIGDGAMLDSLDTRSNPNGRLALNWAALNDRVDAIRLLLALGAPIDAANWTGFTALHHAAEVGSTHAARVLLEAGASAAIANLQGQTALDVAREHYSDGVIELLEAAARDD